MSDRKTIGTAHYFSRLLERVEAIVKSKRFENDFERIGVVLFDKGGEFPLAPLAEVELDPFVLFFTLAFFDNFSTLTVGTTNDRPGFSQIPGRTLRFRSGRRGMSHKVFG